MFTDSVFVNFKIGGPLYRASSRGRTVGFLRLEVYHFISLIKLSMKFFILIGRYFGFCVSQRQSVS